MRIIMMGTGPFAVPTLLALYQTRHDVMALATAPLRQHRGKPIEPISSIREVARQHGTPIVDPEDINLPESRAELAEFRAELLVVGDYGQILSPATLATARCGGINLHASLLPKYRGAAPVNWAIYHGETETGVTIFHIAPQIDAGPCIAQARTIIGADETAAQLEVRLAELGARLICDAIDLVESGRAEAIPQDAALASKAPRLKKTDGLVDWSRPAAAIKNQVRAMEPWPRTYSFWHQAEGPPVRLILGPVTVADVPSAAKQCYGEHAPGTVVEAAGNRLVIVAGKDAVMPANIQPAGKRSMSIDEFLRGYHVRPGDRFGGEE